MADTTWAPRGRGLVSSTKARAAFFGLLRTCIAHNLWILTGDWLFLAIDARAHAHAQMCFETVLVC